MPRLKKTNRGFKRGDFIDLYGKECSIQESSLGTEQAVWLGANEGVHHLGDCLARMHLNRKMAKRLIPMLQKFVDTGSL